LSTVIKRVARIRLQFALATVCATFRDKSVNEVTG